MLAKTTSQKQHYWLKHVKAADLSDGTIADYAIKTDISLKSLYQWKTKLIRLKLYNPDASSSDSDFVPVNPSSLKPAVTTERSGCTVTLPNGLVAIVEGEMHLDPFSSKVFVFCNAARTIIKIVAWEGNGFILWMKRIEKARFRWPVNLHLDIVELNAQQINWLLDGYDLTLLQGHSTLPHHTVL